MTSSRDEREALVKLWRKFAITRSAADCWPWIGHTLKKGNRGTVTIGGKTVTAPRLAWFIKHNQWPDQGVFVCHSCDNPNCVNPAHLWLGTNRDNMRDAAAKKRLPNQKNSDHIKGEGHGNAKMTDDLVREIRRRRANGEGARSIAKSIGMSPTPVFQATNGKAWKHVK